LTDGNADTGWMVDSSRGSASLTVDLGDVMTLWAVGWLPGAEAGACGLLTALEQSADGVTWSPVEPARAAGAIGAPGVWQLQAAGGEARFVRWTVTASDPAHARIGCLAEVAVWGAAIVPVEPTPEPTPAPTETPIETPIETPAETPVVAETPVATEPPAAVSAPDSAPDAPAETTGEEETPATDPAPAEEAPPTA
jgi:hypothetical protein